MKNKTKKHKAKVSVSNGIGMIGKKKYKITKRYVQVAITGCGTSSYLCESDNRDDPKSFKKCSRIKDNQSK